MNSENWQAFNFILSENINPNINEQLFENKVIQAFGEIGWKEYSGNIKVRPSYRVGSVNTIEPDLVFRSDNYENLFVVEVKRPSIKLNSNFQDQLFSYMRQLKLDLGILIGEKIQIFYDGSLNKDRNPILLESIDFNIKNMRGEGFVELFNKSNFTEESKEVYVEDSLKRINMKKSFHLLESKLLSKDFSIELFGVIKGHLTKEFDEELVDKVLNNFHLSFIKNDLVKQDNNESPRETIRFIPAKESRARQYTSSHGALPITLNPSDEYDFKRRLITNKTAWITTNYLDGRSERKRWDAHRMTENSNLLGNLRSRPNFRNGQWQKLGIKSVYVSIN